MVIQDFLKYSKDPKVLTGQIRKINKLQKREKINLNDRIKKLEKIRRYKRCQGVRWIKTKIYTWKSKLWFCGYYRFLTTD